MKSFVLLAIIVAAGYYYHLQHPGTMLPFTGRPTPTPAATPVRPRGNYHSPLDSSNGHNSAGYYSDEPVERYNVTGPGSTRPTRTPRPVPAGDAP